MEMIQIRTKWIITIMWYEYYDVVRHILIRHHVVQHCGMEMILCGFDWKNVNDATALIDVHFLLVCYIGDKRYLTLDNHCIGLN